MWLQALRRFIRGGHLIGRTFVMLDLYPASRALFLLGATDSGLLHALRTPRTRKELVTDLGVTRTELLDGLLAEGIAWREIAIKDGRYRLRGRRARALVSDIGDAYFAQIQECFSYHGAAYGTVRDRLRGAPLGNYLDETGDIVARSSRILEAPTLAFLDRCLKDSRPASLLDIGCGSGIYLRCAAKALSDVQAVGVDMHEAATDLAVRNLKEWGISGVRVVTANILDPPHELGGLFEMITLFHNLYYFEDAQRTKLIFILRELLAPGGSVVVVSYVQGRSRIATHFDNVLRNTQGNTALPTLDETVGLFDRNGFSVERPRRLVPRESLFGLVARTG
ncbi:MAG: class I SAM-dependent methyltransferase [Actinomycetota bacterium]